MLLGAEPLQRERNFAPITAKQSAANSALRQAFVEQSERDQPPERRVDTAEIPEIRLAALRRDEFRDLAIRRLILRQRLEPRDRSSLELAVSGDGHAERADRGVAAEDRRITTLRGARRRRRGEN